MAAGVLKIPSFDTADTVAVVPVGNWELHGTAEAGTDYIESKGSLIFHPGTRRAEVCVTIVEDDAFEPDETFTVRDQLLFPIVGLVCCVGIGLSAERFNATDTSNACCLFY